MATRPSSVYRATLALLPLALIGVSTIFAEGLLIEAEVPAVIDRANLTRTHTVVPE